MRKEWRGRVDRVVWSDVGPGRRAQAAVKNPRLTCTFNAFNACSTSAGNNVVRLACRMNFAAS